MDVQLYVYDLSNGLARSMSQQFLGIQIDAVYHTAIVIEGIEYFYGAGIQSTRAGSTHHGKPMEIIKLGRTELPIELTLEYLDSLKRIYTQESYDLFMHNCNNFSHDFAMFLVGTGIPSHITQLPQTVLNTPFGRMLRPMLDQSMRSITQAPVAPPASVAKAPAREIIGSVKNVTSMNELKKLLASASQSCAVIFFTSSTCGPCKVLYPVFDELAQAAGAKATLIKVDINYAQDIANEYKVRATPTIWTYLKGQKEEEWAGADASRLKNSVEFLIRSAFPPHPHAKMSIHSLMDSASKPVVFKKIPPLEKLTPKLGTLSQDRALLDIKVFLTNINAAVKQENPVPSLPALADFMEKCIDTLPVESVFAAYDLFRIALIDPRICAYFAEDRGSSTMTKLISFVNTKGEDAPYSLRIVALHLGCNYLSGPLSKHLARMPTQLLTGFIELATSNLLDTSHTNVRVAAASLTFNLAAAHYHARLLNKNDDLKSEQQVELVAAAAEALNNETESADAATGLILALGLMVYMAPLESEMIDLCKAVDLSGSAMAKKDFVLKSDDSKEAIMVLTQGLE